VRLKPCLIVLTLLAGGAWVRGAGREDPPAEREAGATAKPQGDPAGASEDPKGVGSAEASKDGGRPAAKGGGQPEAVPGASGGDPKAKAGAADGDPKAKTGAADGDFKARAGGADDDSKAKTATADGDQAADGRPARPKAGRMANPMVKADTPKGKGSPDPNPTLPGAEAKPKAGPAPGDPPADSKPALPTDGTQGDGGPACPTDPAAAGPPPHERLYSMTIRDKEADDSIIRLCAAAGVTVEFISPAADLITVSFQKVPLHKALDLICGAADLHYRETGGKVVVGLTMDLDLQFPKAGEKDLDAVYRCRHMEAEALVQALAKVLPNKLKLTQGPRFQSPAVDSGNDPSGTTGEGAARALNATDNSFKVHDILLTGPADLVRRGLMLARKFDRPRKQVRIDVRITEIDDNLSSSLGLNWMSTQNGTLTLSAIENTPVPPANATTPAPTVVPGIKLGSFSHTPLQVNATLSALESEGKAKTLSNPTLLLLDGERSFILSGSKILYPKFTGKDQSGQSIFDVSEIKVGVYLQVAVQIGMSHDVVMSLMPQVTDVTAWTPYNGGAYPTIATREAQTTVHAYSGEMVALGGLRAHSESQGKDGIPFLKDLPFFGKLFATTTRSRSKTDLMIFLTPRVDDDLDHVERIPVEVTDAP